MAECIVEVCRIEKVFRHPNADALELAQIKGWQCVVPLDKYRADELVTYIPIDAMIPVEHSDRWGITKYLSVKPRRERRGTACGPGAVRPSARRAVFRRDCGSGKPGLARRRRCQSALWDF